jgi:hypothetical protein
MLGASKWLQPCSVAVPKLLLQLFLCCCLLQIELGALLMLACITYVLRLMLHHIEIAAAASLLLFAVTG